MTDIAIRVENLGKMVRIGRAKERHDTLRDALMAGLRAPLDRLRGNGHGGDEDIIRALKDVSFVVQRGEVIGVMGTRSLSATAPASPPFSCVRRF